MIRLARRRTHVWPIDPLDLAYLFGLTAGALLTAAIVLDAHPSIVERIGTTDFAYIWSGPRAILESDDPYDPLRWAQRTTDHITPVYSYPPAVALALLPLAVLPLTIGWLVWTVGGVLLAVIAVRALTRTLAPAQPAIAAIAGFLVAGTRGSWTTLLLGQATFVLLAALAATIVALRSGRDRTAGLTGLALAAKPHLFAIALLAFGWVAFRRHRQGAVLWFAAGAIALGALSAILFPRGWLTWLETVPVARVSESGSTTIANAARDLGLPGVPTALLFIGFMLWVARRFDPRSDGFLAVWTALALAAAFYERFYDHLLLVVPAVLSASVAARSSDSRGRRTLLAMTVALVPGTIALVAVADLRGGFVTFYAFLPAAVFLISAVACWPRRQSCP